MMNNQDSFLSKAMQLCTCMMQLTGCELYSHNTRSLLEGLNSVLNTLDDAPIDKVGSIRLLIDTLLEEEGIAEAELLAGCDSEPDYDNYDWPEDYDNYYQYPDPMRSAAEAFEAEDNARYEQYLEEDAEMNDWVNSTHDELNVELKQIDKEIEEHKLDAAIWYARESIMDKLCFENGDIYPVHTIKFEVDEYGRPVDIIISSRIKYLDEIAEKHGHLGYSWGEDEVQGFYEALYGRLDKFVVKSYNGEIVKIG